MTTLLPPKSWTERKRRELHEVLPTLHDAEKGQFVYIGCCIDFTADTIDELQEAEDPKWPEEGQKAIDIIREHCGGFDKWCEVMGYEKNQEDGLVIDNDWSISYAKSYFQGIPCYVVDHSRIEYIWVHPDYIKHSFETAGTETGRVSCSKPNIANKPKSHEPHSHNEESEHLTPAEKARNRHLAKGPHSFTEIAHSSQEMQEHAKHLRKQPPARMIQGSAVDFSGIIPQLTKEEAQELVEEFHRKNPELSKALQLLKERGITLDTEKLEQLLDEANDVSNHSLKELAKKFVPFASKEIPLAISMTDMDKWGCPYCSYHQGQIPATAEGTMLWICVDCQKGCHVLTDGLEMSAIAHLSDIYPQLSSHPLKGTPKRAERRVTTSHEQDSNSQDDGAKGLGDGAEGQ